MSPKRFYIVTFGCQMNVHDSEKISGLLTEEGYSEAESAKDSDLVIFNTCSIRQKAEQKFFSGLGRIKALKRKRPDLKIAVAGCIAQQMGDRIFRRAPYVDFVFGPQNIHRVIDLIQRRSSSIANDDNQEIAYTDLPVLRKEKGRAWVSITYGCNNFCSYCIVPYTRGMERSRPSGNILKEIRGLSEEGFREVTLLGQNVNSYRSDMNFAGLLGEINSISGIERIRFVTSHPRDLSGELISAISMLDKVCDHIHLPLQSGSDRILGLMNRGYTFHDYCKQVDSLRKSVPGISITTDIIAGFPGEKEDDHMMTINALKNVEFDGIFAFKFSPRQGTKAAAMGPQVDDEMKSKRLTEILQVQDSITLKLNKKLENSIQEILVEGPSETDNDMVTGRTRSNKIVNFKGNDNLKGKVVHVRIVLARKHSFEGELL
ncbi:MAG TPA: tRNA (N6-isopentenyl adenosine(37)-C2)-methylthiotransferase MiaB [Thermodesulfovibrionales bacterium]|nr:tRNA (N6-isopentenyl adenosine(37)-C2)-methylthiotransferase MiaB [Thermodesulfovibrionales bacterium]